MYSAAGNMAKVTANNAAPASATASIMRTSGVTNASEMATTGEAAAADAASARHLTYSERIAQAVDKSRPFPMPEWPGREELTQVARIKVCSTVVSRFQAYAFCELPPCLAELFDKTVESYSGDKKVPIHSFLLKPETKPNLVNHLIAIYLVNSYVPSCINVTVQLKQMCDELRHQQTASNNFPPQRLEFIVISLDRNCPDLYEKIKAECHSHSWWYLPQSDIIDNEKLITSYIEQLGVKYIPSLTILTPAGGFVIDANARDDFLKKGRSWFTNLLFAAQQAVYFPEPVRVALGPEFTPKPRKAKREDKTKPGLLTGKQTKA